jgi:hypothetical protein
MNDIDKKIHHTSILVNKLLDKEDLYNKKKLKTEKTISLQKDKLYRMIKKEKEKFQNMKIRLENELTIILNEIQTMKIEFDENISRGITTVTAIKDNTKTIEKKENNHA